MHVIRGGLVALLSAAVGVRPAAGQTVRLQVAPASRIAIFGTSNVHNWDCSTTSFDAAIDVPAGPATGLGKDVRQLDVTIPVQRIDCGSSGMTANLRKAMHADKHPTIHFRMTAYDATPALEEPPGAYTATLKGLLTVNGTERSVTIAATVVPDGKGGVRAKGSTDLRTTDFGVKPVRALLGTIKTGERVTIALTMVASEPTP